MRPLTASFIATLLVTISCGPDEHADDEGSSADLTALPPASERSVQMIHLDGFRPDVVKAMVDTHRLPNFEYLISRGKVSYRASTVDKSETMKVIQSYLTSRLDTEVVGWWQFSRGDFRFRNYWIDPGEVVNYALGLDFPLHPTVLDLVAKDGGNPTAGMSLARRGVPFVNYARPYLEGFKAVSDHSYYSQMNATMEQHLAVMRRIANSNERTPRLSTLLLAPADEFAHYDGVIAPTEEDEHCFVRGSEHVDDGIFKILDEDKNHENGGNAEASTNRYFTNVKTGFFGGGVKEVCVESVKIPLEVASNDSTVGKTEFRTVLPEYQLALVAIDIKLGQLINGMRSVRYEDGGRHRYVPTRNLPEYINRGQRENSLFERTLFLMFGDHGMVDSKHMMAPPGTYLRDPASIDKSFLDDLNAKLGLVSGKDADVAATDELGINYTDLPKRLVHPNKYADWQSPEVARLSGEAKAWATDFFGEVKEAVRTEAYQKYWWLFFLRSTIVDPRIEEGVGPITDKGIDTLSQLYLAGEPSYVAAETAGNRAFFDRQVRMVYGGGALNNAEIFLPACTNGSCSWAHRPSYEQIVAAKGGTRSTTSVVSALLENPGVGLVFIRKQNDQIAPDKALPASMDIQVLDCFGNEGTITVTKNAGQLVFRWRVAEGSPADPIGLERWVGQHEGTIATYRQWNDWGVERGWAYPNVVGGIGAYLYSTNPAIGDVLAMHNQGWNFGDNAGGHGGVHRGEKLTLMLASGPGVGRGEELLSEARFEAKPDGTVVAKQGTHFPSVLDVAPTALAWLGYAEDALPAFERGQFPAYLKDWRQKQRADILDNLAGVDSLNQALAEAGFDQFKIDQFRGRLERLLQFTATSNPTLPDSRNAAIDGVPLDIPR